MKKMIFSQNSSMPEISAHANIAHKLQFLSINSDQPDPQLVEMYTYFAELRNRAPSNEYAGYLQELREYKNTEFKTFAAGVRKFLQISNMGFSQRKSFYGNEFYGVHYADMLADAWNARSGSAVKYIQLNKTLPTDWYFAVNQGEPGCLVYQGNKPSVALDMLLLGPTVIDCGMFSQLSIWFGIRYMLGDYAFDRFFGKQPFYVTKHNYEPIINPFKPYSGNPLFAFISEYIANEECIEIRYIQNDLSYSFKHPGGFSRGHNCVVIDDEYNIFARPNLSHNLSLTKTEIEDMLLDDFNANPNHHDQAQLDFYASLDREYLGDGLSYASLLFKAEELRTYKISGLKKQSDTLSIKFDLRKFHQWIENEQKRTLEKTTHKFLSTTALSVPDALLQKLPYENKGISHDTYQLNSELHQMLDSIAQKFCSDVLSNRSALVLLGGEAGIGKTATAVMCAKELTSRNKMVLWLSEVTQGAWVNQCTNVQEYLERVTSIRKVLATENPDVVFFDDNNFSGYTGKLLLAEIYSWYMQAPGKALFITSNNEMNIASVFGFTSFSYVYPVFVAYDDQRYTNQVHKLKLQGNYMRPQIDRSILTLTDEQQLKALQQYSPNMSQGILLKKPAFDNFRSSLADLEFVPAYNYAIFDKINKYRRHQQMHSDTNCSAEEEFGREAWQQLTQEQLEYLQEFERYGRVFYGDSWRPSEEVEYVAVVQKNFSDTLHQYIAVELIESQFWDCKEITRDCMTQLVLIINYAHDHGGKKIILVNNTSLSNKVLLDKIEEKLNPNERDRTMSRLNTMLFADEFVQTALSKAKSLQSKLSI